MRYRKPTSKPVNKKIGVVTLCVIVLIAIVFGIWCVQWTQMENSKGGYVDMTEINKKDPTQEIEAKFMEDMNPAYRYQCQFSGSTQKGEVKVDVYIENGKQIASVTFQDEEIDYETPVIQGEEGKLIVEITASAGTTGIIQHSMNMSCRNITWLSEKIHVYFEETEDTTEEGYQE